MTEKVDQMYDEIDATQAVAVAATLASVSRRPRASKSVPMINLAGCPNAMIIILTAAINEPLKRYILV